MRLPWPFQRPQRAPAAPSATTEAAAAHDPQRPPRGAWRELPPLAETVGPAPLTAPSEPFAADLTAPRAPTVLAELGHGRGLDAPAGLVVGIARAARPAPAEATAPASSASEPLPTLRRRAAPAVPDGDGEAAHDLTHVGGTEETQLALAPPSGTVASPRGRGTLQRAALAPTPVPSPAEGPAAAPQGADEQSRATPGPPSAHRLGPAARSGRPLTVTRTRRVGLGTPLGSETPIAQRSAAAASPITTARVQPATLGQAPPSASQPEAAPLLPLATSAPTIPASRPLVGQVQRLVERPRPAGTDASFAPPTLEAPAAEPTGRAVRSAAPASSAAGPMPAPVAPLAAAPTGPSALPAHRPPEPRLLGKQPLTARIQRAPLTSVAGPEGAARSAGPHEAAGRRDASAPVPIHRGDGVAEASATLGARAFTQAGEIYLPASHGPLGSPPARSLLDHELTHVVQQRVLGADLPAEDSPVGRELELQAVAAEAGRSVPLALPPITARRASATRALEGRQAASSAAAPASPTAGEGEAAAAHATAPIQRAGAVPASSGTISATGPAGERRSERELEELARQLYGRLRSRLRQELLADRERAGLVSGR